MKDIVARSSNGRTPLSESGDEGSTPSHAVKECNICLSSKPLEDFAIKRKSHAAYCKDCHNIRNRAHYQTIKSVRRKEISEYRQRQRENNHIKTIEYFDKHPCVDCSETDIIVLDFHHLDRESKLYNVGVAISTGTPWTTILKEIKKCDVLCSNCHRRRTAKEVNSWRYRMS